MYWFSAVEGTCYPCFENTELFFAILHFCPRILQHIITDMLIPFQSMKITIKNIKEESELQ